MSLNAWVEKIERLINVLYNKTANHSVQWAVTSEEDAFRLPSDAANVRIERKEIFNQDHGEMYTKRVLEIFNKQGRLVDDYSPQSALEEKYFDDLFSLARRSAHNTDDLLDQLLDEIQR